MLVIFILWPLSVIACLKARKLCERRLLDLRKVVVCVRTTLDRHLFHLSKDVDGAYALSHGHDHYGRFCGLNHLKDRTTYTMYEAVLFCSSHFQIQSAGPCNDRQITPESYPHQEKEYVFYPDLQTDFKQDSATSRMRDGSE